MNPFTFSYRGLTFGEGTEIIVEDEIGGLRSLQVDSGSRPAPQFNGSIPGRHLARAFDVVFPLRIFDIGLLRTVDQVFQPHPTAEFPMQVRLEGDTEWLVYLRPVDRREIVAPNSYVPEAVPYRVALERTDPHWYGTSTKSVEVPIYSLTGGGFDLASDLPLDMGAATEQVAVAVNDGNADAYPLLRLQRPSDSAGTFSGFTMTNETTEVVFDMDVSIAAGQTLFVDFFAYVHAARDIDPIHIDNSTRFSGWNHPRDPLYVASGSNTLKLTVDGTADDTLALITFRDTSL